MAKKAAFHNLGCKVNAYELDAMQQLLEGNGYEIVGFEEKADLYVINTCTVTNIADRKSRQMLHRARKMNPDAVVVAVGCYVQSHADEILEDVGIDLCIGNNQKGRIAEIIEEYLKQKDDNARMVADSVDYIGDINTDNKYEDLVVTKTGERCRAFIKIQDGCNQFCSYCIIPHARGRVRSRSQESVVTEIQKMTELGYQEFVLTGIHLSSYGTDFEQEKPKADQFGEKYLIELFQKLHELPGVKRIRLGSLEPRIITPEFMDALKAMPKICPHFHLSLQSGCDATLKRMNRHYTAQEFMEKVKLIRQTYEHPAITTDVIVGFPGEDEKEFEECRKFLEEVAFFEMHIFKYSKRKNTPAATMPGQLTDAQKSARSDVLEAMEKAQSRAFREYYVGKEVSVLFEEQKEMEGRRYWIGHTPEYVMVACLAENVDEAKSLVNEIHSVQIREILGDTYAVGDMK